ncbi:MAG: hypothetical protein GPJ52_03855 [Candidatus Heimdallarchaeota archaeon]|nr:hypothetical protein [Candidatus Heimdallarchaeota archaeon]
MKRNMSRVGYQEVLDPLEWRKELRKETSVLRYCIGCGDFMQFEFKTKNHQWIYLHCPACLETVKIPRKKQ